MAARAGHAAHQGLVFSATDRTGAEALESLLKAVDLDRAEKMRNKH